MSAMRKPKVQEGCATFATEDLVTVAWDLYLEVVGGVAPNKVSETSGQWLGKAAEADDDTFARAMVLAMDLEAFALSSLGGSTPFDRLARRRAMSAEETAALAVIKDAKMVAFRIAAPGKTFSAINLVDGARMDISDEGVGPKAVDARAFARLCALPDGTYCTLGPITPLDDAGLAVAFEHIAKGKEHRCAAAVYKHVIRHGNPKVVGLNYHPEEEERFAAEADRELSLHPIDIAAQAWVAGGTPTEDLLADFRAMASIGGIVEGLFKAFSLFAKTNVRELGEAYRAIAELHIRTLQSRFEASVGSLKPPLDAIAEVIDEEVRLNGYPIGARALFESIRDTLRAESRPKTTDDELTKVIERIRALRAKTPDQGCTESEALAAATKVAELLDRYGLTLSAIEIERQTCEGVGIDSSRKRNGPLDECVQSVAAFCDCRAWQEHTDAGFLRTIFFGLPADVAAAQFVYERVAGALETETARFKAGEAYANAHTGDRRRLTNSFQLGLVSGIRHKLKTLEDDRERSRRGSGGRDLVPLKAAAVEDGLSKLGMKFKAKESARRLVEPAAYRAGQVAGRQFQPRSDIEDHR